MLRLRPDLSVVLFRGNVDTRLSRLNLGEADATLLAAAGLERLGRHDIGSPVPLQTMLPAPAQGAVGIEARRDDDEMRSLLAAIDDAPTGRCVLVERAMLARLGATCHSPVAALAVMEGDAMRLRAQLLAPDGSDAIDGEALIAEPAEAALLAADLLARAPDAIRAHFDG